MTGTIELTREQRDRVMAGGIIAGLPLTCDECEQPAVWSVPNGTYARLACYDLRHIAYAESCGSEVKPYELLHRLKLGLLMQDREPDGVGNPFTQEKVNRPEFRCSECEATDAPLYVSPRNDGHNVQIVHACEHLVREWYTDAPEKLAPAPQAEPVEPMGTGHKCTNCGERIDVVLGTSPITGPERVAVWVHDRTGQRQCSDIEFKRDDRLGIAVADIKVAAPSPEPVCAGCSKIWNAGYGTWWPGNAGGWFCNDCATAAGSAS